MEARSFELGFESIDINIWYSITLVKNLDIIFCTTNFLPEIFCGLAIVFIILFNFVDLHISAILAVYLSLQVFNLYLIEPLSGQLFLKTWLTQVLNIFITVFSIFISNLLKNKLEIKVLYILFVVFL